jgi:hypothetical protein
MPASIPTRRTTALVHIINDPIMGLSLTFRWDFASLWKPELTHDPRLCDLMSRNRLAYLFLGNEPVERFKG